MSLAANPCYENIGTVVIGRNEGRRLRDCLESLVGRTALTVYVDSGSSDRSLDLAQACGAMVISLDTSKPFTAARGRQVGLDALIKEYPNLEYVQFIDGDCTLEPTWFDDATKCLSEHSDVVAVCARRRETNTGQSFYSRLIDIDWDITPGEVSHIGGDALMRIMPIYEAGGWPIELIAGEEPDLCFRLRDQGWKIWRLPVEATKHDVAMHHFSQYWQRAARSGYAYAQVGLRHLHGAGNDWLRRALSIVCYGFVLPIVGIAFAFIWWPLTAVVAALYLRVCFSMYRSCRKRDYPASLSLAYAMINCFCKLAGAWGVLRFVWRSIWRRKHAIIEYKHSAAQTERAS